MFRRRKDLRLPKFLFGVSACAKAYGIFHRPLRRSLFRQAFCAPAPRKGRRRRTNRPRSGSDSIYSLHAFRRAPLRRAVRATSPTRISTGRHCSIVLTVLLFRRFFVFPSNDLRGLRWRKSAVRWRKSAVPVEEISGAVEEISQQSTGFAVEEFSHSGGEIQPCGGESAIAAERWRQVQCLLHLIIPAALRDDRFVTRAIAASL